MKSLSLLMILPAFLAVQADKPPPSYNPQPQPSYGGNQDAPAQYNFQWSVLDNPSQNNYGQQESRDGSNTVGSYYVLLPDGRTQRVSYTVDAYGGYKAEVTYEGEARAYQPAASQYQPTYQQPAQRSYEPQPQPARQSYTTTPKPKTTTPAYRPAPTTTPAYRPAPTTAKPKPGQIYYKPVENHPEPEVYYKPLPQAASSRVYYKDE